MELNKSIAAARKKNTSALLNTPMEPYIRLEGEEGKQAAQRMPPVTLAALKPVFKELGMSDKVLDPANMTEIMRIFEVSEGGSELLEDALTHGIPHNILNAKFHEQEAIIIAEAGRKGAVTIATNMAGRGVDILLGGKHINQELPPVDGSVEFADPRRKCGGKVRRSDRGRGRRRSGSRTKATIGASASPAFWTRSRRAR